MRKKLFLFLILCGGNLPTLFAGERLTAEKVTPEIAAALTAYTREVIAAVGDGRSPTPPNNLPLEITRAVNGVVLTILRGGEIVTSGHSFSQDNLLNNLRLAAGRASFDRKIADFPLCTIAISILSAPQTSPQPAPLFRPALGLQAYQLTYRDKNYFMPPLRPLLQRWDWEATLSTLLAENLPQLSPDERLAILLSSSGTLKIFPAFTLIAAPQKTVEILDDFTAPNATKIPPATIEAATTALITWWAKNQTPLGAFAHTENPDEMVALNAFIAFALGRLYQKTPDEKLRTVGLRLLDWLLLEHFVETAGYLVSNNDETAANAALLAALLAFNAAENNPEIARRQEMLRDFLHRLRADDGTIYELWRGQRRPCEDVISLCLTIDVLFTLDKNDPAATEKNAAALDKLLAFFAPINAEKKYPPLRFMPWLTAVLSAAYMHAPQKKYLAAATAFNEHLLDELSEPTTRRFNLARLDLRTELSAMTLFGVAAMQTLSQTANAKPLPQLATLKNLLLAKLLAAQNGQGINALLWTVPENTVGGFTAGFGDANVTLLDTLAATLALSAISE